MADRGRRLPGARPPLSLDPLMGAQAGLSGAGAAVRGFPTMRLFGMYAPALVFGLSLVPTAALALPPLESRGIVAPGVQFSAEADDTTVHIISQRYVQIDAVGTVLADERDVGDGLQGPLDMYPAIALGPDGSVHVVTRNGGSGPGGTTVDYAVRAAAGGWSAPLTIGGSVPRNYSVGVAVPSGGRVFVSVSRVAGDSDSRIDLYAVEGGVASLQGSTPQGWLRPDGDYRLVSAGNAAVLASGSPWPNGSTFFALAADASGDVMAQWEAGVVEHTSGSNRRGGPSLTVDGGGLVHLGYGGESAQYYARYDNAGTSLGGDVQVMDNLGTWHLSYGNGDVVASPDGMLVVAVGLQNLDGDQTSAGASILLAESVDGGATFGPPVDTGLVTDGGEGRMRPRLLEVEGTAMLLYRDNALGGIALATAPWFDEEPEGTTGQEPGTTTDAGESSGDGAGTTGDDGPGGETGVAGSTSGTGTSGATGLEPTSPGVSTEESGCGCRGGGRGSLFGLVLLCLLGLRRRRADG